MLTLPRSIFQPRSVARHEDFLASRGSIGYRTFGKRGPDQQGRADCCEQQGQHEASNRLATSVLTTHSSRTTRTPTPSSAACSKTRKSSAIDALPNQGCCAQADEVLTMARRALTAIRTPAIVWVCDVCPLREQCVGSRNGSGRPVRLHPREASLQRARRLLRSEGHSKYRQRRVAAVYRLARLSPLGVRQARYLARCVRPGHWDSPKPRAIRRG